VLFTYAEGVGAAADQGTPDEARAYGAAVGMLHLAMEEFTSAHARAALDLDALLGAPLRAVEPFLVARPAVLQELASLAHRLRASIVALDARGLAWGVCHGDCHGGNAHRAGDAVTFFDFDCAGPGWWAYDLSVFLWMTTWQGTDEALVPPFLQGYQSQRPLSDMELAALPTLAAARQIWFMGLQAGTSDALGTAWLAEANYERELAFLRKCVARARA
jgi:Ser/Thr protein kinase RdoA (MazF antagonist)